MKQTYIINGRLYKSFTALQKYATNNNLSIIGMYQPNPNKPLTIVKLNPIQQTIQEINYLLNN